MQNGMPMTIHRSKPIVLVFYITRHIALRALTLAAQEWVVSAASGGRLL